VQKYFSVISPHQALYYCLKSQGLPTFLYRGFQMSAYSFENKKTSPVRVLSFHFAVGKMKTAITEMAAYKNSLKYYRDMNYVIETARE
jgi:hypothetical protein